MYKHLLLIFVLILLPLGSINAFAWNSKTHQLLVENVFNSMPVSLQEKLNLTLMKEGAVAPDLVFHNTVKHHYPFTKDLAFEALSKSKNLSDFSFNFGVAAHYISDSFVAPHYISKEDPTLHSKFENQVNAYQIKTECANYNLTLEDLKEGEKNGEDWAVWLETKDPLIPAKELEQAQKLVYSIAIQSLNYECNSKLIYEEKSLINYPPSISSAVQNKEIAYPVILVVFIIFLQFLLFKKRRKKIFLTILVLITYLIYKLFN